MSELPRKDFITLAWKGLLALSGLLGLGGLLRFLGYQSDPALQTVFDLGAAEEYPPGSRTLIPDAQAMVIRTGDDFAALSLVCPHLGCQVETTAEGFTCPCHGSQFSASGAVLRGPADQPLRLVNVEKTPDGHLILYT
jgi:cytochrome b6-f complex iron-sulfur subunit